MQHKSTTHLMAPNACPPNWRTHQHTFTVGLAVSRMRVWDWLNSPETFTEGQPPFFRVEFVSPDPQRIPANFSEGVLTVHHGPLLNFAGVLAEIKTGEYRDLQYFYGSYALSMRLIRPVRLQFWVEELIPGITCVHGQVDSYVRPWLYRVWTVGQQWFWGQFGRMMQRTLEREAAAEPLQLPEGTHLPTLREARMPAALPAPQESQLAKTTATTLSETHNAPNQATLVLR